MSECSLSERGQGHVSNFYIVDLKNFATSLSLVMSECSLSGRGQGRVSNFYIVDFKNFATASHR